MIALQINNWNNYKIDREVEIKILNEILLNLESDLKNLDSKISLNDIFSNNNAEVLQHLENKTPLTDSLRFFYSSLLGRGIFQPITVGYENLKARGIDLIQNDSLRYAISELYDFKYYYFVDDVREDIFNVGEAHSNQVWMKIASSSPYRSAEPINLDELQIDLQFQEVLKQAIFYFRWMNGNYNNGKNQIVEVLKQIKNELNERGK